MPISSKDGPVKDTDVLRRVSIPMTDPHDSAVSTWCDMKTTVSSHHPHHHVAYFVHSEARGTSFNAAAPSTPFGVDMQNTSFNLEVQVTPSGAEAQSTLSDVEARDNSFGMKTRSTLCNVEARNAPFDVEIRGSPFGAKTRSSPSGEEVLSTPFDVKARVTSLSVNTQSTPFNAQVRVTPLGEEAESKPFDVTARSTPTNVEAKNKHIDVTARSTPTDVEARNKHIDVTARSTPTDVEARSKHVHVNVEESDNTPSASASPKQDTGHLISSTRYTTVKRNDDCVVSKDSPTPFRDQTDRHTGDGTAVKQNDAAECPNLARATRCRRTNCTTQGMMDMRSGQAELAEQRQSLCVDFKETRMSPTGTARMSQTGIVSNTAHTARETAGGHSARNECRDVDKAKKEKVLQVTESDFNSTFTPSGLLHLSHVAETTSTAILKVETPEQTCSVQCVLSNKEQARKHECGEQKRPPGKPRIITTEATDEAQSSAFKTCIHSSPFQKNSVDFLRYLATKQQQWDGNPSQASCFLPKGQAVTPHQTVYQGCSPRLQGHGGFEIHKPKANYVQQPIMNQIQTRVNQKTHSTVNQILIDVNHNQPSGNQNPIGVNHNQPSGNQIPICVNHNHASGNQIPIGVNHDQPSGNQISIGVNHNQLSHQIPTGMNHNQPSNQILIGVTHNQLSHQIPIGVNHNQPSGNQISTGVNHSQSSVNQIHTSVKNNSPRVNQHPARAKHRPPTAKHSDSGTNAPDTKPGMLEDRSMNGSAHADVNVKTTDTAGRQANPFATEDRAEKQTEKRERQREGPGTESKTEDPSRPEATPMTVWPSTSSSHCRKCKRK